MQSVQVTFRMRLNRERAFLRQYLTAAWDRFDAHSAVGSAYFWRFGDVARHEPPVELAEGETVDGGGVVLVVTGEDPAPVVEAERDRWERLREEGLLDTVEVTPWADADSPYDSAREKMLDNFGPVGGDRSFRLRPLIARTTVHLLEEFEEDLPAVAEPSEENPAGVGDWVSIHYLMKQNGHDWYDEIDACQKAVENRLHSLANFYDEATAREALEGAIDDLEALRSEFDAGEPERVSGPGPGVSSGGAAGDGGGS
ncbi:hypothetical protein [Halobaculum sp. MBLA0143]|uniref:hypothetical protein n=1 Tax=Halobaculum sp. MBLA0143 TaxID=3079933 RepID=UPI003523A366